MSSFLVLNNGSSSLKCAVWNEESELLFSAHAECLGSPEASVRIGEERFQTIAGGGHDEALKPILDRLGAEALLDSIAAVGHRVVHGGEQFSEAILINDDVLKDLKKVSHLAPLHNPANISGIESARRALPKIPHVAVFDTAFHQSMPEKAYRYALPEAMYREHGFRRYGFHGSSHRWIAQQACDRLQLDPNHHGIISAHLGNGCSACAIENGLSVDTTMGMTPLAGLVMGTRCGDIDPSVFPYLSESANMSVAEIHQMLNKESGLLGLSGKSNDMRSLVQAAEQGHQKSELAVAVFCYQFAKQVLSLCAGLQRLDALVFTGGIGENAAHIRKLCVEQLAILGLEIDGSANESHGKKCGGVISAVGATKVVVIATNEELQIARDVAAVLAQ